MRRAGRWLGLLLLALGVGGAAGCFGVSQNPSYFPYLVPFGDVIPTHPKPPGHGYYENFDPHAVKLVVERLEATSQVRTQHVLLATVYDDKNVPRRNRRVEWKVEGVGQIVEVDESGHFPGRGYVFNRDAVSYTSWGEHRISRGNGNAGDDVMVRPGQTWCVLSSPVEGDTHVTVYAPGVHDWDKRVVHATIRWVDVTWEFPPPAVARFGTEHVFTTRVFRFTDRKPLQNYQVRYKILDGPPAAFVPSRTQEFVARSDVDGNAPVAIAQLAPAAGVNRVSVEIIRPPDPTTPSGVGLVIATGETRIEWLAPSVTLNHTVPPAVALNQEVVFTTTLQNAGRIESKTITVTAPVVEGFELVRTQPPSARDNNMLVWTIGELPPGQTYTIQQVYNARKAGPATSVVSMVTGEGQRDQKSATTNVTVPGLKVGLTAPAAATVGTPVTYTTTLTNTGNAPIDAIVLEAEFDEGLAHASNAQKVSTDPPLAGLGPGQSRTETLVLTPKRAGTFKVRVTARAGGLIDRAEHTIVVQEPKLSLSFIDAPQKRIVGRPAEFKIRVANDGDVPLTGLALRDRLPAELEFVSASDGGQFVNGEVVWSLGTLDARKDRIVTVLTKAARATPAATQIAVALADGGLRQQAQAAVAIEGMGAIQTRLADETDPVEVGKVSNYRIEITNTGSAPVGNLVVKGVASPELRPTKAGLVSPVSSPGQVAGQGVAFGKYDSLRPGEKLVYVVEVQGVKAGDGRFQIEVTTGTNPEPIVEQESTRVIAPLPGPNPPAPPPPGGGTAQPLPPE
jgi:uncharacterized repeat protein (TIGR01451 family)